MLMLLHILNVYDVYTFGKVLQHLPKVNLFYRQNLFKNDQAKVGKT